MLVQLENEKNGGKIGNKIVVNTDNMLFAIIYETISPTQHYLSLIVTFENNKELRIDGLSKECVEKNLDILTRGSY